MKGSSTVSPTKLTDADALVRKTDGLDVLIETMLAITGLEDRGLEDRGLEDSAGS